MNLSQDQDPILEKGERRYESALTKNNSNYVSKKIIRANKYN